MDERATNPVCASLYIAYNIHTFKIHWNVLMDQCNGRKGTRWFISFPPSSFWRSFQSVCFYLISYFVFNIESVVHSTTNGFSIFHIIFLSGIYQFMVPSQFFPPSKHEQTQCQNKFQEIWPSVWLEILNQYPVRWK